MPAKKPGDKGDAKAGAIPPAILTYAMSAVRTRLGDGREGIVVTEEGKAVRFSCKGTPFATVEVQGEDLVVSFLAPKEPQVPAEKLAHYRPAKPTGWLEFRTPVSRDPKPWLQSGFGSMVGRVQFELSQSGGAPAAKAAAKGKTAPPPKSKPHSLHGPASSAGGPFLVLPEASAAAWNGSKDAAGYEAVCKGPDQGRVIEIAGRDALVLGTPDLLFAVERPDGVVFARAVSHDDDNRAAIETLLQSPPAKGWKSMGQLKLAKGPLLAFDASASGGDRAGLKLKLAAGTYSVHSATLTPDDDTELLVTWLRKADG